jgi:hypothetical protein
MRKRSIKGRPSRREIRVLSPLFPLSPEFSDHDRYTCEVRGGGGVLCFTGHYDFPEEPVLKETMETKSINNHTTCPYSDLFRRTGDPVALYVLGRVVACRVCPSLPGRALCVYPFGCDVTVLGDCDSLYLKLRTANFKEMLLSGLD